jgi:hypothetical protein
MDPILERHVSGVDNTRFLGPQHKVHFFLGTLQNGANEHF